MQQRSNQQQPDSRHSHGQHRAVAGDSVRTALRFFPAHLFRMRSVWRLFLLSIIGFGLFWLSIELPDPQHLRAQAAKGDTRIFDRHGRLIASLPDPLGNSQHPIALDQIPLALRQATIAVEDRDFYTNPGIDLFGIVRAARQNLAAGEVVAGGSTITQQLARNFLLDPQRAREQSFGRKLHEAILALKLTATYSKDEIIALYLNQTFYGNGAYGVEAAAWRLFGKPARDLDLAEAALIAGLPQAPSRLDPFADGGTAARLRQQEVLATMLRAGFITPQAAQAAAAEPLQFADRRCRPGLCQIQAPHFVAWVLNDLEQQLGSDTVARGGLTITTTLDLGLNETAQAILKRQIDLLSTPRAGQINHNVQNGAVLTLDPSDGAILAMIGSPDFANDRIQGQVNATIALRQPGSALKPLTYAAALERGWSPASILLDIPSSFTTSAGQIYRPLNYDRRFHGPLSLREALATSSNVATVRLLNAIGLPALLSMAEQLGIESLGHDPSRYGLALTLGGGEVTLLELTGAYAAFANGGNRITPYGVIEVRNAQGALILHHTSQPTPVLKPAIAFLINDILADRYARMRAFGDALTIERPAAVKTGTTTDWRDNWAIGYTPDRVVGVWIGNADGSPMQAISGVSGAGPVWRAVMRAAHQGIPVRSFRQPDGITTAQICTASGLLASSRCPTTRSEYFLAEHVPTEVDHSFVAVPIDRQANCRAPHGYPAERTVVQVFQILPAEASTWAIDAGIPQVPRSICQHPQASSVPVRPGEADSGRPFIQTPANGAIFAISAGVPAANQRLSITARVGGSASEVVVLVDGQPIATLHAPPYRTFWQLQPGRHTITVVSYDANRQAQTSQPVTIVVE